MLDFSEMAALLRRGSPTMSDKEVNMLFRACDRDGTGKVDFGEFVDFVFARNPSPPYYVHQGKQYRTLGEVHAAISAAGAQQARTPQQLLEELDKGTVDEQCAALFHAYAGPDRRLQMNELVGLATSVAAAFGLDVGRLGNMAVAFHRFDFSGDGALSEVEASQFVRASFRHILGNIDPSTKQMRRTLDLPKKVLQDEYDIQSKLGNGSQGSVYLANHRLSGQPRVVKFFKKSNTNVPLDAVRDEFRLLGRISHPKIQKLHEIFEDLIYVYVTSEPYTGGTLMQLFKNARAAGVQPNILWLSRVLHQVLEAVAYLHGRTIIHADLKEANVMIKGDDSWENPEIVVIDFGLAGTFVGSCAEGGTPGYMPPEVYMHKLWTPKGDVHALGVVFYQVMSGRVCYPGGSMQEVMVATLSRQPDLAPVGQVDKLPPLLVGMLHKDFRLRFTAADCLRHSFFAHVEGLAPEPLSDEAVTAFEDLGHQHERRRDVLARIADAHNLAELSALGRLLAELDPSGSGALSAEQVRAGLQGKLASEHVEGMLQMMRHDGDRLQYRAFIDELLMLKRKDDQSAVWTHFNALDATHDGVLSLAELAQLLQNKEMARIIGGRSVEDLMKMLDVNHDGKVTFEEFQRLLESSLQ